MTKNPWDFTPRRVEVLDALVEVGCSKLVARRVGMELCTVAWHMTAITRRMGVNRTLAALYWDRWKRQESEPSRSGCVSGEEQ